MLVHACLSFVYQAVCKFGAQSISFSLQHYKFLLEMLPPMHTGVIGFGLNASEVGCKHGSAHVESDSLCCQEGVSSLLRDGRSPVL